MLIAIASPVLGDQTDDRQRGHAAAQREPPPGQRRATEATSGQTRAQNIVILTTGARSRALQRYQAQLAKLPDVAMLAPPGRLSSKLDLLELTPATTALSPATQRLVSRIDALRPPFAADADRADGGLHRP